MALTQRSKNGQPILSAVVRSAPQQGTPEGVAVSITPSSARAANDPQAPPPINSARVPSRRDHLPPPPETVLLSINAVQQLVQLLRRQTEAEEARSRRVSELEAEIAALHARKTSDQSSPGHRSPTPRIRNYRRHRSPAYRRLHHCSPPRRKAKGHGHRLHIVGPMLRSSTVRVLGTEARPSLHHHRISNPEAGNDLLEMVAIDIVPEGRPTHTTIGDLPREKEHQDARAPLRSKLTTSKSPDTLRNPLRGSRCTMELPILTDIWITPTW